MSDPTDFAVKPDDDGIYDLYFDDEGDLAMTDGYDSAVFISLFTARRARPDEVAAPLNRRGWIGDMYSEPTNDPIGSGMWLYEQSRLDSITRAGIRMEAVQSLDWMAQERAIQGVGAEVTTDPANRSLSVSVSLTWPNFSVSTFTFDAWNGTVNGQFKK